MIHMMDNMIFMPKKAQEETRWWMATNENRAMGWTIYELINSGHYERFYSEYEDVVSSWYGREYPFKISWSLSNPQSAQIYRVMMRLFDWMSTAIRQMGGHNVEIGSCDNRMTGEACYYINWRMNNERFESFMRENINTEEVSLNEWMTENYPLPEDISGNEDAETEAFRVTEADRPNTSEGIAFFEVSYGEWLVDPQDVDENRMPEEAELTIENPEILEGLENSRNQIIVDFVDRDYEANTCRVVKVDAGPNPYGISSEVEDTITEPSESQPPEPQPPEPQPPEESPIPKALMNHLVEEIRRNMELYGLDSEVSHEGPSIVLTCQEAGRGCSNSMYVIGNMAQTFLDKHRQLLKEWGISRFKWEKGGDSSNIEMRCTFIGDGS